MVWISNFRFQLTVLFGKILFYFEYPSIVSARPGFRDVGVKSILMNVLHLRATMEEFVLIYPKDIDVNAHQDSQVKIVKMKKVIANLIHAPRVQCARMNLAMETTHVFVEAATRVPIAM